MQKYALGKGKNYKVSYEGNTVAVYRAENGKIFRRTFSNGLSTENHVRFGDELLRLTENENLLRIKSELYIA